MHNHTPKIYAQLLVSMIREGKSQDAEKKIIRDFLYILDRNHDMHKAKEILDLAENLYYKETGRRKITLETARPTDIDDLMGSIAQKGDFFKKRINKDLVAGIRIMVNDEQQLDLSLKGKLEKILQ